MRHICDETSSLESPPPRTQMTRLEQSKQQRARTLRQELSRTSAEWTRRQAEARLPPPPPRGSSDGARGSSASEIFSA